MSGKHSEKSLSAKVKQLEEAVKKANETIALKEKEIHDIKFSVSDILLQIRNINESNDYSDSSVKRRRISELCTDTRYQLLIDEVGLTIKKIELPNTTESTK